MKTHRARSRTWRLATPGLPLAAFVCAQALTLPVARAAGGSTGGGPFPVDVMLAMGAGALTAWALMRLGRRLFAPPPQLRIEPQFESMNLDTPSPTREG